MSYNLLQFISIYYFCRSPFFWRKLVKKIISNPKNASPFVFFVRIESAGSQASFQTTDSRGYDFPVNIKVFKTRA